MKALVVIVSLIGICSGSTKQWQLDVNFNNPKNWDSGKTPCANNRIVFPETVTGVFFQTNISSVKEVVLPKDGVIVMPSDLTLSFSDNAAADPQCDGGDINFVRTNTASWFDPDNWQDLDDLVTVETERVPCRYDKVTFPEDKLFNVGLTSSITIGTMKFSGQDYTSAQLGAFLNSDLGKMQFTLTNGAAVSIQGTGCPRSSGCSCGNDDSAVMEKICNQYNCLATSCSDAVTPEGGCCPLCGAILTMEYSDSYDLATFKKKIHDDYHIHDNQAAQGTRKRRELNNGEVDTYTSKTSSNKIQMVLTDKAAGSRSGQTAINLAQTIMTDMQNDPASFGITSVDMKSSQRGTGSQTGLSGGGVVGIVMAVIVLVVICTIVGFFVLRRRGAFFGKDEPLHADMEVASDIPVGFMENIPGQPAAMYMQSFDNPVYNAPGAKENLYDDPTRVATVDVTDIDPDDLKGGAKKASKQGKGPLPETLTAGFDNPNYASSMETGIDDFTIDDEKVGATGVDLSKTESES